MVEMTDEELDEVAAQMVVCKYQKGDAIVVKGDIADGLYQVISGAANVEIILPPASSLSQPCAASHPVIFLAKRR